MNPCAVQSSTFPQLVIGNPNLKVDDARPSVLEDHASLLIPHHATESSAIHLPPWNNHLQYFPDSLSQLLLTGLADVEERTNLISFQDKHADHWNSQLMPHPNSSDDLLKVKQENSVGSYLNGEETEDFSEVKALWPHLMLQSAPSQPCFSGFGRRMLDFSGGKEDFWHPALDTSSDCDRLRTSGRQSKKARVHPSPQSTLKVRREKLGDRINALHQLVSPFGKTDTASVLLEAIGYIRFLQSQIEALCSPYFGSGFTNVRHRSETVQGERNCLFSEEHDQLLNADCNKSKALIHQEDSKDEPKNLRKRGLCLIPISRTMQVDNDNGADYWASTLGMGFQ